MTRTLTVLIAVAMCLAIPTHASSVSGGTISGGGIGAPTSAAYRTVVIFGDTQFAVQAGQTAKLAAFNAQVDWVVANMAKENIDFVLHVGDIINEGSFLPTTATCDSGIDAPLGTCLAHQGDVPACLAEPGCFNPQGTDCWTCDAVDVSAAEWSTFDSVWSKFDTANVAYAIVRGNHDNIGVAVQTERDTPGYNQLYDSAFWEARETAIGDLSRFNHVLTDSSWPTEGDLNVWRFNLGSQTIEVVGPSYEGGANISQSQLDFVVTRLNANPAIPKILLVHDTQQNGAIRTQTWDPISGEPPTPSVFLSVSGHIGTLANFKSLVTNGSEIVMQSVIDWSRTSDGIENDYFAILRFYLDEAPTTAEAFDYSPEDDLVDPGLPTTGQNTIAKQAFDITPPASTDPYDLSPYTTEIAASLGTHTWPTAPTITSGPTAATDCSTLIASAAVAGRHTTVAAGVTIGSSGTPCGTVTLGANTWLELEDTAILYVSPTSSTNSFQKVSGGVIHQGGKWSSTGTDIHIDNVVMDVASGPNFEPDTAIRFAITNSTLSGGSYNVITTAQVCCTDTLIHSDITIVGNDLTCGTAANEACVRVMSGDRTLIAANLAYESNAGGKACYRFYTGSKDSLVIDNQCQTFGLASVEIRSTGEAPLTFQRGTIDNVHVIDNRQIEDRAGSFNFGIFGGLAGPPGGISETCTGMVSSGNQMITPSAAESWNEAFASCTGTTTDNGSTADLDLTPYFGVIPTCASLGTCGADH